MVASFPTGTYHMEEASDQFKRLVSHEIIQPNHHLRSRYTPSFAIISNIMNAK